MKSDYRFYKIIQSSSTPWFSFCQLSNKADIYIFIYTVYIYIEIFFISYFRETMPKYDIESRTMECHEQTKITI